MKKQTAVGWLIEQLQAPCRGIPYHIIEQANKMFEQQIIDAHNNGKDILPPNDNGEQYYNETYNTAP